MLDAAFIRDNLDAVQKPTAPTAARQRRRSTASSRSGRRAEAAPDSRPTNSAAAAERGRQADPERPRTTAERSRRSRPRGGSSRSRSATWTTQLKLVEDDLRSTLLTIPNMTHPDAPVGTTRTQQGRRDVRRAAQVRLQAEGPRRPVRALDLADFEAGTKVAGQKFYFLKNEAALLEIALVQYAMQTLVKARATRRSSRRTWPASRCWKASASCRATRPGDAAGLHRRRHRPVPDRHRRDHPRRHAPRPDLRRGRAADEVRRAVALLPHRGRGRRPRHPRAVPRPPVHQGGDVRLLHPGAERGDPPGDPGASRRRSSRGWGCPTTSSTPAPATSAGRRTASTTSKRGCPAAATAASTAR